MQKVSNGTSSELAEVHFYMLLTINGVPVPLAVASFYGPPHQGLYHTSSKTYITVQHFRDVDVRVIDIKAINSVVMMAPDPMYKLQFLEGTEDGTEKDRWFMMEKPGLKVSSMIGMEELEMES